MPENKTGATKEKAKSLWIAANQALEDANVARYLEAIHRLHQYMTKHHLTHKDIKPELKNLTISSKAWAVLEQLHIQLSSYSKHSATLEDSHTEPGFVSAISIESAYFMDCKLDANERSQPDTQFKLSSVQIVIDIMERIKKVANFETQLYDNPLHKVMSVKIDALNSLKDVADTISDEIFETIFSYKGSTLESRRIQNIYEYASYKGQGRKHLYEANLDKFEHLKKQYQDLKGDALKGDALKTEILMNFKERLKNLNLKTPEDVDREVRLFKKSDEYSILETGQGLFTQTLGLKTDSIKAFEKIVQEIKDDIGSSHRNTM